MDWQFFVALVIVILLILFPAAVAWYLDTSGVYRVLKNTLMRKASRARSHSEFKHYR